MQKQIKLSTLRAYVIHLKIMFYFHMWIRSNLKFDLQKALYPNLYNNFLGRVYLYFRFLYHMFTGFCDAFIDVSPKFMFKKIHAKRQLMFDKFMERKKLKCEREKFKQELRGKDSIEPV